MYTLPEVLALMLITVYCFAPLPPDLDLDDLKKRPLYVARITLWPFIVAVLIIFMRK